jgi:multidrug efflux pump subunit AcrA (membrane-fusion protein)
MKKLSRKQSVIIIASILCALIILKLLLGFIGDNVQQKVYRPVTVIEIKETNPELKLMLTGVVKSWVEEYFSFEVPGRIKWVIEKGKEVGKKKDKKEGTIIARIDPIRYQLKLRSLKAKTESAESQAEALRVLVNEVMLSQLEAINANLENAKLKFQRQKRLLERNAVSRQNFDNAATDYRVALAKKAEAMATVETKKAEYKSLLAQVEELRQNALDAELNIKKCTLRTPYKGKIAEVNANIGANVTAGENVVKVVVMNPMLVSLEVSANIDRMLRYRDKVKVYPSGINKSVPGIISMKSTVADPGTHTFNLELFVQNPKIPIAGDLKGLAKLPEIGGVWQAARLTTGEFVNRTVVAAEAVKKDAKGEFVWKAVKAPGSRRGAVIYTLNKQYVNMESQIIDLLGIYSYKIAKEKESGLNTKEFLAFGVPEQVKSGDKVIEIARRWLFRPGDLAKVVLNQKDTPSGIYVPIESIFCKDDKSFVYLVKSISGKHFCKPVKVEVELLNQLGAFQRIKSKELKTGDKIIFSGVHYIDSDDEVVIKEVEEISL